MNGHCEFEPELLDALAAGRWPSAAEGSLRADVAGCAICADVAEVAAAFLDDREVARTEAVVPSAGSVWWRCQLRAREESARLAARPIAMVQALATICVAAVSVAAAPSASVWLLSMITSLGATGWWPIPEQVDVAWVIGSAAYATSPLLVVGIWIVLAPVLVYLALDD